VIERESSKEEISLDYKQADELANIVKPHTKTKQEQDTFPKPDKEGCHLDDPEQIEKIHHYLLIVLNDNNSDKYRYDAAKHLATYYYNRPIYYEAWKANEKRILGELNNTVKKNGNLTATIIEREIPCLFEAVHVIKEDQSKREAVKAVWKKLHILMLEDVLGEGWRNKPREAEILFSDTCTDKETDRIVDIGADQALRNIILAGGHVKRGFAKDLGKYLDKERLDEPAEDEVKIEKHKRAGVVYHDGVADITGGPSEEWAEHIQSGQISTNTIHALLPLRAMSAIDESLQLEQIMNKAKTSEFQKDIFRAIHSGMSQTTYAKLHNIKPSRVWKATERGKTKMERARKALEKDD